MGLMARLPLHLGAVLLVLLLHVLVNVLNRYMNVLLMGDDDCDTPGPDLFSCHLLVFLLLFWLIESKPKLVKKYGLPVIQAELFLQLMHVVFLCQLFFLRIGDIIPQLADTWLGNMNLFKTALMLAFLFLIPKLIRGFLNSKSDGDACCGACSCSPCTCARSSPDPGAGQGNSAQQPPCVTPTCSTGSFNRNNNMNNCWRPPYIMPRRPYCGDM